MLAHPTEEDIKYSATEYHPSLPRSVFPRPEQNVHTPEFFFNTQNHFQLFRMIERTKLRATIHVSVDRGFFREKGIWTCYRRNYFQLNGLVSLTSENPHLLIQDDHPETGVGCYIEDRGEFFPVRKFWLQVSASTQHNNMPVELVQHTPQRDKGPKSTPLPKHVRPTSQSLGQGSSALFERLQFKRATANNGKRRSTQQFFILSMDLFVELNDGSHRIVATTISDKIVVRGRSPGHYSQSEANASNPYSETPNYLNYRPAKSNPSQIYNPYLYNLNYSTDLCPPPSDYKRPATQMSLPIQYSTPIMNSQSASTLIFPTPPVRYQLPTPIRPPPAHYFYVRDPNQMTPESTPFSPTDSNFYPSPSFYNYNNSYQQFSSSSIHPPPARPYDDLAKTSY